MNDLINDVFFNYFYCIEKVKDCFFGNVNDNQYKEKLLQKINKELFYPSPYFTDCRNEKMNNIIKFSSQFSFFELKKITTIFISELEDEIEYLSPNTLGTTCNFLIHFIDDFEKHLLRILSNKKKHLVS